MRRLALAAIFLAGCTWSNSLYQARRLSNSAAKAEREDRTFDAGSIWGQVAVKAESAYARGPEGRGGAEALWLRGRALAHLGDCPSAVPLLEQSQIRAIRPEWGDELVLELARCRSIGTDPASAVELLERLFEDEDPELRRSASLLAGRSLASAGRWSEAVDLLSDDDSETGRWQLALSLANLGRGQETLDALEPRLLANDSLADWTVMLRALAATDIATADRLIDRLADFPRQSDTARARWMVAAAEGVLPTDRVEAERRFNQVLALGPTRSASTARLGLIELAVREVSDSLTLAEVMGRLEGLTRGDPISLFRANQYRIWADGILEDLAAMPLGVAEGDLALWFHAEIARDTLGAPRLADWLLQRLERGWPESPYLAKALLARILTLPDSAPDLRERLLRQSGSEYLAYVSGNETARFSALEDSLDLYLSGRFFTEFEEGDDAVIGDDP